MLHVRLEVHSHQEGKQQLVLLKQTAAHLQGPSNTIEQLLIDINYILLWQRSSSTPLPHCFELLQHLYRSDLIFRGRYCCTPATRPEQRKQKSRYMDSYLEVETVLEVLQQVVDALVQLPGLLSLDQGRLKQAHKPGQAVLVHRLHVS